VNTFTWVCPMTAGIELNFLLLDVEQIDLPHRSIDS
jgi:hypothetical protein